MNDFLYTTIIILSSYHVDKVCVETIKIVPMLLILSRPIKKNTHHENSTYCVRVVNNLL